MRNELYLSSRRERVAGLSVEVVILLRADGRMTIRPGVDIDIQSAITLVDWAAPAVTAQQDKLQGHPPGRWIFHDCPGAQRELEVLGHILDSLKHSTGVAHIDIDPTAQGVSYGLLVHDPPATAGTRVVSLALFPGKSLDHFLVAHDKSPSLNSSP